MYEARYNCGKELARLFKIDADIVAGVPDSATVCARGYADVSGLPMVDALTKNRYIGRTFIQPSQSMRESSVKIKLNAFRSNIKGKRLILIDDSIVRGTTSRKIISLLRASGATEVHMLVGSPPVKCPCYFGVDMETKDQLIGAYKSEEEICKEIGADSLHYIPLDLMVKSCGGGPWRSLLHRLLRRQLSHGYKREGDHLRRHRPRGLTPIFGEQLRQRHPVRGPRRKKFRWGNSAGYVRHSTRPLKRVPFPCSSSKYRRQQISVCGATCFVKTPSSDGVSSFSCTLRICCSSEGYLDIPLLPSGLSSPVSD